MQPCAEAFLRELMGQYEAVVYQINDARQQYNGSSALQDLLIKEAIYLAVEDCASAFNKISQEKGIKLLDFGSWLESTLMPEASQTDKT